MKISYLAPLGISIVLFGCTKVDSIPPLACFTYTHSVYSLPGSLEDTVWFENCSTRAATYLWDFGDGTSSTEENPMHIFTQELPVVVSLTALNDKESDVLRDTIFEWSTVRKPNIYLYPKENTSICISLNFPKGGEVIASIPLYQNGWCVTITPSGKIDGAFDYLFYESTQPDVWQRTHGWCIEQTKLEGFFKADMKNRGFARNEINDFVEYWIPLLNKFPYYTIFPQTKEAINWVIDIEFSVQPEVFYRLFYCIKGSQTNAIIDEPISSSFSRNGFTAVEWA